MDFNERFLIESINNGDAKAFETLFKRYYSRLCAFAAKYVLHTHTSEEIVQHSFYSILIKEIVLNPEKSVKAFLFTIVYNNCMNYLKKQQYTNRYKHYAEVYLNETLGADTRFYEDTSSTLLVHELEDKIEQAINTLPDRCREIFKMSRFDGMKYSEISERLQISVKTVETQMTRALVRLRLQLKDYLTLGAIFIIEKTLNIF